MVQRKNDRFASLKKAQEAYDNAQTDEARRVALAEWDKISLEEAFQAGNHDEFVEVYRASPPRSGAQRFCLDMIRAI